MNDTKIVSANDDSENLIGQVNQASTCQTPIVIEGSGTKRFLGRAIDPSSQIISTHNHTGIINYDPVELVMTARAGTTLAEIDAALAENNQALACDPARFNGKATIGGSLASNQAGPSRPWVGSLRDHVLGVNLINGKGEYLRFGGKVMKNVAGYDVSRLQAGAMGTLGLMTEISFKVLPKQASTVTLRHGASQSEAITIMNTLAGQANPLTAAAWADNYLHLQFSGAESAVNQILKKSSTLYSDDDCLLEEDAKIFWENLRDQQLKFFSTREENQPLWRFSINSTAAHNFKIDQPWLIDWAGSLRWLKGDFDIDELQEWASSHGGEVTLYTGGDRSKEIFSHTNTAIQKIQQRIKTSFDPHHIFNTGRLYHWM